MTYFALQLSKLQALSPWKPFAFFKNKTCELIEWCILDSLAIELVNCNDIMVSLHSLRVIWHFHNSPGSWRPLVLKSLFSGGNAQNPEGIPKSSRSRLTKLEKEETQLPMKKLALEST